MGQLSTLGLVNGQWAARGQLLATNALEKANPIPREVEETASKLGLRGRLYWNYSP